MATAHHEEKHFRASESVRDVVIGMSGSIARREGGVICRPTVRVAGKC